MSNHGILLLPQLPQPACSGAEGWGLFFLSEGIWLQINELRTKTRYSLR